MLPPAHLFLSTEQFFAATQSHASLAVRATTSVEPIEWAAALPDLTVERAAEQPLAKLSMRQRSSQQRMLVLAESDGRRESLLDFIRAGGISPVVFDNLEEFLGSSEPFGLATSSLHAGFAWLEKNIDLVTETELFAATTTVRRRRKQEQVSDVESLIKDLSELNVGDPVVHSAHGIGRYRGLVNLDMGQGLDDQGQPLLQEFLHLEYADEATLYVPVSQLHLISRYSGVSPDQAPVAPLGFGSMGQSPPPRCRASA